MADEELRNLTAEEAIRLRYQINQQITYGPGLDARRVRDMESLTPDQQAELKREVAAIPRSWGWLFPDYVWFGVLLIGVASYFYFRHWAVILAAFFSFRQLVYRSGLAEGYGFGYESGYVTGIRKALGISAEEAEDIRKRAIEMSLDDDLIRHWDAEDHHAKQA